MTHRSSSPCLTAAAALLCTASLCAQDFSRPAADCANAKLDSAARIRACNTVIQSPDSDDMELAVAYTNRGDALDAGSDYVAAIKDYDQALDHQPDYAPAFNNRGSVHLSRREYDRALRDFDAAIHINPKVAAYYTNRGAAHLDAAEFDEAGDDFDRAVLLAPTEPNVWSSRCLVHAIRGDLKSAQFDCDHSLQLMNHNAPAIFSRAFLELRDDEPTASLRDYNDILRVSARDLETTYGRVYAETFFSTALYGRGIAEHRNGDQRAAKADLAAAAKIDADVAARFEKWGIPRIQFPQETERAGAH